MSAFRSIYFSAPDRPAAEAAATAVVSPFLLTPQQQSAVRRSRSEPVTVLSGAPGTGKSQTVVAIACDALSRGSSVLVTARSDATVDALVDLFEKAPGPVPVVFGSNERRVALAHQLEQGILSSQSSYEIKTARGVLDAAIVRRDELLRECLDTLRIEVLARDPGAIDEVVRVAPLLVDGRQICDDVRALMSVAETSGGSWLARWRRRRANARALQLAGVAKETPLHELRRLVDIAVCSAELRSVAVPGNEVPAPPYDDLLAADDAVRKVAAQWLALTTRSVERAGPNERRAVAALATALRSGRAARREQLMRLDNRLTRALPLWVGSLPDVDDLLPHAAGLFDLVIVDESSSVDQPMAAPALLRGHRCVIVGDPRQLRPVSFVADDHLDAVRAEHGLEDDAVAAAIDVRRNSLFDVAAAASAVTQLDEHFRSDPHLVEFVAERVYDGAFAVATRSPLTQDRDCISVRRCAGSRDAHGVVAAEVDRVVEQFKALLAAGARSVGVMTPFRAQNDALELAVLDTFSVDELERMDLRVATVHGFQGNERDVVLISLGIGPDEGAASWRFAEDPHLFAVMVTRAKRHEYIFYSAEPPAAGLLSGYLQQADSPPGRPAPVGRLDAWAEGLATELAQAGVEIMRGYPVGRHVLDICVAGRAAPTGIICSLHIDGEVAHVERQLALRGAGWDLFEGLPGRWSHDRAGLVVSLLNRLDPGLPVRPPTTNRAK